jgi:hypothetical protein
MPSTKATPARQADLERSLGAVEQHLDALALALGQGDTATMDTTAAELHRALAGAINEFSRAARAGQVPAALRQRLALAGAKVAAQREALARATASLDRAVEVLMPERGANAVYAAHGGADRRNSRGESQA